MLISYSTNVASIIRHRDGKERAYIYDDNISNATLSHIKEFLRQNGFKADTKQQILKDYHLKGD